MADFWSSPLSDIKVLWERQEITDQVPFWVIVELWKNVIRIFFNYKLSSVTYTAPNISIIMRAPCVSYHHRHYNPKIFAESDLFYYNL